MEMRVNTAAILLFGKNPQMYFPRARVRFIKYDGIEEKFGTQMNNWWRFCQTYDKIYLLGVVRYRR